MVQIRQGDWILHQVLTAGGGICEEMLNGELEEKEGARYSSSQKVSALARYFTRRAFQPPFFISIPHHYNTFCILYRP
jgi:hypothetical protein